MKTDGKSALPNLEGNRVAIVSARFYGEFADWLEAGARARSTPAASPSRPPARARPRLFRTAARAAQARDRNAASATPSSPSASVIRGETPHFDYVAGECARGIMTVQLAAGVPIGFGVLTTETLAQAEERADPARGDKGYYATLAALSVL